MTLGFNDQDIFGIYLALRLSLNRYGIGFNFSFYIARLADGNVVALNIAVNSALDGYFAVRLDRSGDSHTFPDHQGTF